MTDPLQLVAELADTRRRRRKAYDTADRAWRQGIRDALDAGVPQTAVADAAGVSQPRVVQIRDGRRNATSAPRLP